MALRIKQSVQQHRFLLGFWMLPVLYAVIVVNRFALPGVSIITYAYHLVDFSFGFCTKLLPGAIYHLFFDQVLEWQVNLFENILLFLFFGCVAFFLERWIYSLEESLRIRGIVLCVFYLTGPATFAVFSDELGMLDVYWLFFSLLFLLFHKSKWLFWVAPILCVPMMMVHFSAVNSYILFVGIILLYKLSQNPKSLRNILMFVLAICLTMGTFIYFARNEADNLTYTAKEFHEEIQRRTIGMKEYDYYYQYALYGLSYVDAREAAEESGAEEQLVVSDDSDGIPQHDISFLVNNTLRTYKEQRNLIPSLLALLVLLLPLLVVMNRFWSFFSLAGQKTILRSSVAFFGRVQFFFTLIVGCLCSPDVVRWLTHAFLIQFSLVFYLLYQEKELHGFLKTIPLSRKNLREIVLYFAIYASTTLWPYC